MIPADTADSVLHHEIPVIRKIIADETWLEGERRGCPVSPDDRVVRDKVCTIVLEIGQQLRESITRDLPPGAVTILPTYTRVDDNPLLNWEI